MIYPDRPPLATGPTDSNAESYNKSLPRPYEPFPILEIPKRTQTVDEKGIDNIISIERAAPVVETIENLGNFKASMTSSKEKNSL